MPKLNQVSHFNLYLLAAFSIALGLLLINSQTVQGQAIESSKHDRFSLPDKLPDNWRANGATQNLSADQCLVLPDGEVFREYGLETLITRHYSNGPKKILVEIHRMKFPSGAFGLFTFYRYSHKDDRQSFHVGRYLISISGKNAQPDSLNSTIEFLRKELSQQTSSNDEDRLSPLPSHLPELNKKSDSEIYLIGPTAISRIQEFADLKDVINFDGGTEAVAADYHHSSGVMNLLIIEFHTPQLATEGFARFQNHFSQIAEEKKTRIRHKRIGNYVVWAVNVADSSLADQVISQIKYNPSVSWEGKRLSDIPLAFRPPDPVAIEEASQTALMLIRTFYWVGLMLLGAIFFGVITGGSVFYWKRYQRRKQGIDDVFSDAGGSLRLNLDNYLLNPADYSSGKNDGD